MKLVTGIFLCSSLCLSLICQAQEPLAVPEPSRNFWLLQARLITDDLLNDAAKFERFDRALVLGRLSALWWQQDSQSARRWLKKAIGELTPLSSQETELERNRRLFATRTLFRIATPIDKDSSELLMSMLTPETQNNPAEAAENATVLVDTALELLETSPAQAAALGSASLRIGTSLRLISLVTRLRLRNRSLGDPLFLEVLAFAKMKNDTDLLASLTISAFNGPASPSDIQKAVIRVISEQFLGAEMQTRGCLLNRTVIPLLDRFYVLLPQETSIVRAGLVRCQQTAGSGPKSEVDPSSQPTKTVDDFLEAASKSADLKTRVVHLGRAVYLSAQQQNFDRAVEILDSFSDDERLELGESWDNWRWDFAASAAISHLKKNDRYRMNKIIHGTPVRLRAFVQISVADEVAAYGDHGGATELLEEGRKGLANSALADNLDWYMSLLRRYARHAPRESPFVFREFVTSANRSSPVIATDDKISRDPLSPFTIPPVVLEFSSRPRAPGSAGFLIR